MSDAPRFDEPWHAQVFALTVALSEAGHFGWAEWREAFGATLARHGAVRAGDGGAGYFLAWLEALEGMLAVRGLADAALVRQVRGDWEAAYLTTPHGQPVRLPDG